MSDFFRWVPEARYEDDSDPENTEMSRTAVVVVDDALLAAYPGPGPTPAPGRYLLTWDGDGALWVEPDVPVGAWVLMTNSEGETYFVQRLDAATWHVDGDVTLHTEDLRDVQAWQVLDDDPDGSHWDCGPAVQG